MQEWVIVSIAAFVYALVVYAFNRVFHLDEAHRKMAEFSQRVRKDPNSVSEEELEEHMRIMSKAILLRTAMSLIVFLPLYYSFNARYGSIPTPLGEWYWLWWFLATLFVANIIIGGVTKWLARYSAA